MSRREHRPQPSHDLGRATCSLRGSVVAGSYQLCTLTYTAGFAGIDDTGSLKIVMRFASDAGTPQFDDPQAPNYVTASASNGAQLKLRYDVKDNVRPWGKTIHVKVLQGFLSKGDRITVKLGDRSQGSPGWRMQTFIEETFELRTLVDRYATYLYEPLPKSPTFRIRPGPPVRMVAVASSLVKPGQRIVVHTKLEDVWGNPVRQAKKSTRAGFDMPGCYTISLVDKAAGLTTETNPILVRDAIDGYGRFWADLHGQSEETVGTNSIDDYFGFGRDLAFLDICAHQGNDFQITDAFWKKIQQTTRKFYRPGEFVTFPGWEWSGNTGLGGDRNVLFRTEGGGISRSCRALVSADQSVEPCSETVEQLFDRFAKSDPDAMLIAHVGGRYADLQRHREGLEPAIEVHSAWGTFEWMLEDAFRRSYRVGIVANSDGHKGRPGASYPGASKFGSYGGLTCVLAKRLDRDSVWEAYQSRRVYATTGARIVLDVTAGDDLEMGSVAPVDQNTMPRFRCSVHGTAAVERLELRNGMRILKTFRNYRAKDLSLRVKVVWQGAQVRGRGRQVTWDGQLRVLRNQIRHFETINFHHVVKQCVRVGNAQLQWESVTTGGLAGVILELAKASGELRVDTVQKSFSVPVDGLGVRGRSYDLGGVGKRISTYRLPPSNGPRDLSFEFTPAWSDLRRGDNPLYVRVVQEDGHMAWSSPIYLVRG